MTTPVVPEDFRVDVGLSDEGKTFMRVVHLPTGISRSIESTGDRGTEWARRLVTEIQEELAKRASAIDWKRLISSLQTKATFAPPAAPGDIQRSEAALGLVFPEDLRSLLQQCDGVRGEYGEGLIWSAAQILEQNRYFRNAPDFRTLYMPFDPLLFFADAGNGDQFAFRICAGEIIGDDVFVWDHENDSRTWKAPSLERYVERVLSGRI